MERQKLEECIMDFLSSNDSNVYGDIDMQFFNHEVEVESIWYSDEEDMFYLHVCSPEFEGDLDVHSISDENQEKLFRYMSQRVQKSVEKSKKRTIRLYVGVTVTSSKEDIEKLLQMKDKDLADETLDRLYELSKVVREGDWYIPDECIQMYNEEYGTNFPTD